jgi:hypothetical protein
VSGKAKLNQLLSDYREEVGSLNEKERAALERHLWAVARTTFDKVAPKRRDWFKEALDIQGRDCDLRSQLINHGEWFDVVWVRILEHGLPLTTAAQLARDTKRLGTEEGLSYPDALVRVLKEYDSREFETVTADGKRFRKGAPNSKRRPPKENMDGFLDFDSKSTKKFRSAMRAMVTQHIEARLPDIDRSIQQELLRDFHYGLRVLLKDLGIEVNRHHKRLLAKKESERPSWRRFQTACEVLGAAATPKSTPTREELRKRYRERAAKHHPDRNNGEERYVKQYHAVNQAWDIIKDYYQLEPQDDE